MLLFCPEILILASFEFVASNDRAATTARRGGFYVGGPELSQAGRRATAGGGPRGIPYVGGSAAFFRVAWQRPQRPRPLKVFDPEGDLDTLFAELVDSRTGPNRGTLSLPIRYNLAIGRSNTCKRGGNMDENRQKEQFSDAYLRAVTATAGYNVYKPEVDDDSVDWGIGAHGGGGTTRSPKVELQLKSTSRDVLKDDHVAFPLTLKNYDDLRHTDYQVPRILVVVLVPKDAGAWIVQSEDCLALYHCGYWLSLYGRAEVTNSENVTVHLSRTNIFSVDGLTGIMDRIAKGGLP